MSRASSSSTPRRAIILAAGRGQPLADELTPNCLCKVGGISLIERSLRVLARAGIERVAITVGWQGSLVQEAVKRLLDSDPSLELDVTFFRNEHWEGSNGLSVVAAASFLTERTLLMMADQIAAPHLVSELLQSPSTGADVVLAVDRELSRVFDFDDATKVKLSSPNPGAMVNEISKTLPAHNGISVGMMVVAPAFVRCLEELANPSLTEGVALAAKRGLVVSHDVRGALWQDVDSDDMRLHADWLLRMYGDDLAHPSMKAEGRTGVSDTLALIAQLMAEKDTPRYTLLNPGPVMTSARVKAALVHPDLCHRDGDYSSVVKRLREKLRPVFRASPEHEVILLTGSGTAAMELAISSTVPAGKKLLVVNNGAFGDRMAEVGAVHGLTLELVLCPWGEIPTAAQIEAKLAADPDIAVVAMVHHETSVGVLNPVSEVGAACVKHDRLFIVDTVSSLGAEDLDVVRDHIDIAYASANKCLHSVAGVAFACISPRVWPKIENVAPRSFYLSLSRYEHYMQMLNQTPFTPAVSAFLALEAAVDEFTERGGMDVRRNSYRLRNLRVRQVLTLLGFHSFTNTGRESCSICTMKVPSFIKVDELYDRLKERGFIAYKCKGQLSDDYMQIANMGELSEADLEGFLVAVTSIVEAARPANVHVSVTRRVVLKSV